MNKRNFLKCLGVALAAPSVLMSFDNKKEFNVGISGDGVFTLNGGGNSIKASTLNKMIGYAKDGEHVCTRV